LLPLVFTLLLTLAPFLLTLLLLLAPFFFALLPPLVLALASFFTTDLAGGLLGSRGARRLLVPATTHEHETQGKRRNET
jgi:hypothetical protein